VSRWNIFSVVKLVRRVCGSLLIAAEDIARIETMYAK
jgi:hypothetical protein